ncbi:MAG: hypothetical protein AAFS07_19230, partial [Pseudomonadota bacterium]
MHPPEHEEIDAAVPAEVDGGSRTSWTSAYPFPVPDDPNQATVLPLLHPTAEQRVLLGGDWDGRAAGGAGDFVDQDRDGNVYPTAPMLSGMAWTWSGRFGVARSLLQFAPPRSLEFDRIASLSLRLFAREPPGHGAGHLEFARQSEFEICVLAGPWRAGATSWNTQPPTVPGACLRLPAPRSVSEDYTVELLDVVNGVERYQAFAAHGVLLKLVEEATYRSVEFCSSVPQPTVSGGGCGPGRRPALRVAVDGGRSASPEARPSAAPTAQPTVRVCGFGWMGRIARMCYSPCACGRPCPLRYRSRERRRPCRRSIAPPTGWDGDT